MVVLDGETTMTEVMTEAMMTVTIIVDHTEEVEVEEVGELPKIGIRCTGEDHHLHIIAEGAIDPVPGLDPTRLVAIEAKK